MTPFLFKNYSMSQKPKEINFKDVNMKSKQIWNDDMSVSIFNFQPGLSSITNGGGKKSGTKVLHVGSRRTTSHAIGTRNFI